MDSGCSRMYVTGKHTTALPAVGNYFVKLFEIQCIQKHACKHLHVHTRAT